MRTVAIANRMQEAIVMLTRFDDLLWHIKAEDRPSLTHYKIGRVVNGLRLAQREFADILGNPKELERKEKKIRRLAGKGPLPPHEERQLASERGKFAAQHRVLVPGQCVACRKPIVGTVRKKYCNAACSQRAWRQRQRAERRRQINAQKFPWYAQGGSTK